MKIVTLQSVSGARLKIAGFGKITYSVTCIVALLSEKSRICQKLILKRVKAKLAFARFAVTSARNSGLKSGLFC